MGLSSNNQTCITQDKEGFIWIGTGDGLNRFDGHNFKVFRKNPNDSTSLRGNLITSLCVDSKGVLWVGTYAGGLCRYDRGKGDFSNYSTNSNDPNAILDGQITAIAEDKFGRLWVGTSSMGLSLFKPEINGFRNFLAVPGNEPGSNTIANNHINEIAVDGEILWIAYSSGTLTALNLSTLTFKHHKLFEVLSYQTADFSVSSLVVDNDNIWISTWSKGIWVFNKKSGKCTPYKKESSNYINFIFKDNKNKIWYSPESNGLIMVADEKTINYKFNDFDRHSISSNSLSSIFQDRQGNLWIASKQGDLNCFILDNPFYTWFKNPNSIDGLTNSLVTTVIEDSKRRVWVGYEDGGIDVLDARNINPKIHFKGDNSTGLGPGPVMYFYESKNGTIWAGKYLDGLKKYNEATKSFISYQHKENDLESIGGNDVRYISEDSKGNFWLAIHGGGVDKFNPVTEKFIHYKSIPDSPETSIFRDWTFSAVCDKDDNIWVGSIAGVSVISEKTSKVKHYRTNAKDGYNLSNDIVKAIFFDSRGYVWFGTLDGLNRLDPKTNKIKKYFAEHGLPNNLIIDILEDDHYNLWISTSKGLSKFSPETETFKNYSILDGLVTDEFHSFASFKIPGGEMYFGGRDGLSRFHPDSIKINNFKPPVYITDFKLFNQSVQVKNTNGNIGLSLPMQISYCKEITLEYSQNVITLEFVALNFLNLEKNQYRYKLEGFEKDWTLPGYKREVTYTNLHPGDYTFRVIASNNDGIWNTEGASLRIIVNPPFWRTNWAYALYVLIGISLLYFFRKWILHEAGIKRKLELEELEIQKLHEMDALKMHFFSNVSHEFRTPLTLIVGPVEKLLNGAKDEFVKLQLKLVHRNASRLLRLINQLMDFRKIEESELGLNLTKSDIIHFIKEIVDAFEQDAKQRKIDFAFKYSHKFYEIWFDQDKLDKIIYNLLSNAFKYTPDNGSICISIDFNDKDELIEYRYKKNKTFEIKIKDTGIGIPKEAQSKIFDRFYQVRNTISKQGTGIGLSLTYELVKIHKGTVDIESEPGQGSEFTVILPAWSDENELPDLSDIHNKLEISDNSNGKEKFKEEHSFPVDPLDEPLHVQSKLPRILIIEDNGDMRFYIKTELVEYYNITEAHNGQAGIDKAFEEMPDIIICDVMMPGMDGYEVCRSLKQDERTSHVPIIMLTAKSSEQHIIEGYESGADDYVSKPFSPALLKARIKNLIDSRILLRKKFIKEPFASIKEMSPSKTDEKLFNKAYEIVEKNLNNPDFEVKDFAYEIGMSRTQLYRKINAISGQSVKEFIRIIRLKKAAELLLTSDKNFSEIAYEVGFNSLSYFTTSFTEYFGMNPTKYVDKYTR